MNQPWKAEQTVSLALATKLIESQFPELAPFQLKHFGEGWDNYAFLVNDTYVFRFPRREIAVPWLKNEMHLLPGIVDSLPLAIPIPAFMGQPCDDFIWPFAGYRLLPGKTACHANFSDEDRFKAAPVLGRFLKALHSIEIKKAKSLGAQPDTFQRVDVAYRKPQALEFLDTIKKTNLLDVDLLIEYITHFPETQTARQTALVHGDLYSRHLITDNQNNITGVIDWGDSHIGDPALDLSAIHSFLPLEAHADFLKAYGEVDKATWALARFRAIFASSRCVTYAMEIGDQALFNEELSALKRLAKYLS